jgi:hypothetical protein
MRASDLSDRLVITDIHVLKLDGRPVPAARADARLAHWDMWWLFSAELFLVVLGFETQPVTSTSRSTSAAASSTRSR